MEANPDPASGVFLRSGANFQANLQPVTNACPDLSCQLTCHETPDFHDAGALPFDPGQFQDLNRPAAGLPSPSMELNELAGC